MKVAALQMVSGMRVEDNLHTAKNLLVQASSQGAELVVLPEYFCLLGLKDTDKLQITEQPGHGLLQAFLSQCARDHSLWLVGGTLPLASPQANKVHNSTLVYNPAGECVARYDKMHLFRFDDGQQSFDESRVLVPGQQAVTFDVPSTDGHTYRVGLSICYDLRFPELYRSLHADVILVPSAFTHVTGQAHWEVLLRARAIENQAYVLAAAQGGVHENARQTWGHSMLINPWGEIETLQMQGPGVVLGEVTMARLLADRQRLPALSHRHRAL